MISYKIPFQESKYGGKQYDSGHHTFQEVFEYGKALAKNMKFEHVK